MTELEVLVAAIEEEAPDDPLAQLRAAALTKDELHALADDLLGHFVDGRPRVRRHVERRRRRPRRVEAGGPAAPHRRAAPRPAGRCGKLLPKLADGSFRRFTPTGPEVVARRPDGGRRVPARRDRHRAPAPGAVLPAGLGGRRGAASASTSTPAAWPPPSSRPTRGRGRGDAATSRPRRRQGGPRRARSAWPWRLGHNYIGTEHIRLALRRSSRHRRRGRHREGRHGRGRRPRSSILQRPRPLTHGSVGRPSVGVPLSGREGRPPWASSRSSSSGPRVRGDPAARRGVRAEIGDDARSDGSAGRDHDDPDRYYNVVFFDSHEEAMANSELPVTQEFAGSWRPWPTARRRSTTSTSSKSADHLRTRGWRSAQRGRRWTAGRARRYRPAVPDDAHRHPACSTRSPPSTPSAPTRCSSGSPAPRSPSSGTERGAVRTENGFLGVDVDATFDELTDPDVVVVPGGIGTRALLDGRADPRLDPHAPTPTTTLHDVGVHRLAAAGRRRPARRAHRHHPLGRPGRCSARLGAVPVPDRVVEHLDRRIVTAAGVSARHRHGRCGSSEVLADRTTAEAMQLDDRVRPPAAVRRRRHRDRWATTSSPASWSTPASGSSTVWHSPVASASADGLALAVVSIEC